MRRYIVYVISSGISHKILSKNVGWAEKWEPISSAISQEIAGLAWGLIQLRNVGKKLRRLEQGRDGDDAQCSWAGACHLSQQFRARSIQGEQQDGCALACIDQGAYTLEDVGLCAGLWRDHKQERAGWAGQEAMSDSASWLALLFADGPG